MTNRYTLDGQDETTLAELLAANEECPIDALDVRGIEALSTGEAWTLDMGAGGRTEVRRVS